MPEIESATGWSGSKRLVNIDVVRQDGSFPPVWKAKKVMSHFNSLLLQHTNKVEVCRLNRAKAGAPHHSDSWELLGVRRVTGFKQIKCGANGLFVWEYVRYVMSADRLISGN